MTGFIGNPNVEQTKLLKNIFQIARIVDTDKLIIPAPAQVDPAIQIAQMTQQVEMGKLQVAAEKNAFEMDKLRLAIPKLSVEVEKIRSSIMVDFANVGKISKETELAATKEQLDVYDNIIDQETKQIEVAARVHDAELKHKTELLKLSHDHVQRHQDRVHEKDLSKTATKEAAA